MADEKLNSKLYARYDKQFMVFGSMMNGSQEYIGKMGTPEEVTLFTELMWKKSQVLVGEFVEELYEQNGTQNNTEEIPF